MSFLLQGDGSAGRKRAICILRSNAQTKRMSDPATVMAGFPEQSAQIWSAWMQGEGLVHVKFYTARSISGVYCRSFLYGVLQELERGEGALWLAGSGEGGPASRQILDQKAHIERERMGAGSTKRIFHFYIARALAMAFV